MKHILLLLLSFLLISCNSEDLIGYKDITFYTESNIEITRSTSLSSSEMTDLYVVLDGELIQHQVSTDSDFGSPSLSLSYGTHIIEFFTTKSEGEWKDETYKATKVSDSFYYKETITVSNSTSSTQSITLNRCVYGVKFDISDVMPSNVDSLRITILNHCATYPSKNLRDYSRSYSISSYRNKSLGMYPTLYGFFPEENVSVKVEFTSGKEILLSKTITNIPVEVNTKTIVTGYFFDQSNSVGISLSDAWEEDVNYNINEH